MSLQRECFRMDIDWAKASRRLQEDVRLRGDAVAVRFLESASELSSFPGRSMRDTAICQMILRARFDGADGVLASSPSTMRCVWGAAALGLIDTPPRLSRGQLYLGFVQDLEAGERMHARMGMMGDRGKRYGSVEVAPLAHCRGDPDVVVIYGTPGQMLRLITGLHFEEGGAVCSPVTGQASVCASISRAHDTGEPSLDIPCIGDRLYGLVGDDEMVMVLPANRMPGLMRGLEGSKPMAPYPFRPFTRWSPIFPPAMLPTKEELE